MKLYVLEENGYISTWATTDCYENAIEVEYDGDLEELYKYSGALKIVDNQIIAPRKARAMTLSLDDEESSKTIEIDYERYDELEAIRNAPKPKTTLELMSDALDKAKPTVEKIGYHLELIYNEGMFVWEFVKDETTEENDGSDYLKPISYVDGMAVTRGLWYILNGNTNECILTASHSAWTDEYFDLVEV